MKTISIILPAYNEAEGIKGFNEALFTVLHGLEDRYRFEVIYVLDKSADGTLDILRRITETHPNVRVLALSRRFGHQMSLVAGMDAARGDAAIMMDCDLEHPPVLIPALLERFEAGAHVVHTRRTYPATVSPFQRATSTAFYRLINRLSEVKIEEDVADFRLVSRKVLDVFRSSIREQRQFLRGLIPWAGFTSAEVPYTAGTRREGRSKYGLSQRTRLALSGIISFSRLPLEISIWLGLVFAGLALLHGLFMVLMYFINRELPAGWPTLVTLVSFLGGLQLLVLGLIGSYIGAIFEEVKHRPLYIVEEELGGEPISHVAPQSRGKEADLL